MSSTEVHMTRRLAIPVGQHDHVSGSRRATVILVEYGDYQCPRSGQAYPIVKELQRRLGDSLAFAFRNFPLTEIHPDAERAAETAEWAALSRRFWPMHDFLFEHQRSLDAASLLNAAGHLGLHRRQLEVAWHDRALRHRVAEDVAGGRASGVAGTPTFFINEVRHEGSWDIDTLAGALRAAGAAAR
jgi:protein-disulfide isomerase